MAPPRKQPKTESLRIIAGKWRSRRIEFVAAPNLRPTGDRVRETLFNWLAPCIEGTHCLDLYCGSGVLGFEALSRGGAGAVLVDANTAVTRAVQSAASQLEAENCQVLCETSEHYLARSCERPFNIVFLDPPFRYQRLGQDLEQLHAGGWLANDGLVYFEQAKDDDATPMAEIEAGGWNRVREKETGNIRFGLLKRA